MRRRNFETESSTEDRSAQNIDVLDLKRTTYIIINSGVK